MLQQPRTVEMKIDRLGDKPAFAELKVSFTNFKSDKPVAVVNAVSAEENPTPVAFLAAAEKALADALQTGELGYPMMNAQARIIDAKFDPQLSTRRRVRRRRDPGVPRGDRGQRAAARTDHEGDGDHTERFVGTIIGDLTPCGGQIDAQEMSPTGDMVEVVARVPLRELFTYANEVRSLSQGRAAMGMEPHSYEPAPDEVLRKLMGE